MAEPVLRRESKRDIVKWVRALRLRDILVLLGWAALILAGLLIGAIGEWLECTLLRDIAANLVPDLFVAGLALIAAEAVFGFREKQERRAEEERRLGERRAEEESKLIEAQRKAYLVIAREMFGNEDVLERTVATLQGGQMPPSNTRIEKENWNLLVQSPLVVHLPVQHVWAVHESYYMSNQLLNELIETMQGTRPALHEGLAEKYLPKFEDILARTREAIQMLEAAFISEQATSDV